jgi:hypothetical protein
MTQGLTFQHVECGGDGCRPIRPLDLPWSESAARISPAFCAVYARSRHVEGVSRKDGEKPKAAAGAGYRRALEFLIKDYLCLVLPSEKDKINRATLETCLVNPNWIWNRRLMAAASGAVWLADDVFDTVGPWDGGALDDLKKFIDLTLRWIEMEELAKAVSRDMP